MIDTHTHLYLPEFDVEGQAGGSMQGQKEVVGRAIAAGVEKMIFPNVDLSSMEPLKRLAAIFPDNIAMAMGLHPTEVREDYPEVLETIMNDLIANRDSYVAVGEIGMDLYWDKTFCRGQMMVFNRQLYLAEDLDLPVIIHCREALDRTLEVMEGHRGVPAVFHSFGGTPEDVEKIRRRLDPDKIYFGINGIVTFKNSRLRDTLPAITADRVVIETDSPYLAPVPHRGKRNESSYIPAVLATVASSFGISTEEADRITTANAYRLFTKL